MNSPSLTLQTQIELACILEATARKPGNVHRLRDFPGLQYVDFLKAAAAIGPVLGNADHRPLGEIILECVQATRRIVGKNTNLGIVLLLAPLAAAKSPLDLGVSEVLSATTVADSVCVYEAIRLANPGGLGRVDEQDLANEPTIPLTGVMRLAADRDVIARQYANNFADVFAGASLLAEAKDTTWEQAVVRLHLTLLAELGDTHVRRLRGEGEAHELQELARRALCGKLPLEKLESWFVAEFPNRNPGSTADLVAACLFVALRLGMIALPFDRPWSEPVT